MKNEVLEKYDWKRLYLREFQLFNGENDITFNIVDINTDLTTINIAITNLGKISVKQFDLLRDKENNLYFEYGLGLTKIEVDDFEKIND